jgi:hypothetical protein
MPGEDALGRFPAKLVKHAALFDEFVKNLVDTLRELLPGFGVKLAVDSTDIQAYSNGYRKYPSDLDASLGSQEEK